MKTWYRNLERNAPPGTNRILVANKCDQKDKRVVTTRYGPDVVVAWWPYVLTHGLHRQGRDLAEALDMDYFETSASSGEGVEAMFTAIATQVKRRVIDKDSGKMAESSPSFALQSEDGREGCCA